MKTELIFRFVWLAFGVFYAFTSKDLAVILGCLIMSEIYSVKYTLEEIKEKNNG